MKVPTKFLFATLATLAACTPCPDRAQPDGPTCTCPPDGYLGASGWAPLSTPDGPTGLCESDTRPLQVAACGEGTPDGGAR